MNKLTTLLRKEDTTNVIEIIHICDALPDLVPFARFKKPEKHPSRSVTFSKAKGFNVSLNFWDMKGVLDNISKIIEQYLQTSWFQTSCWPPTCKFNKRSTEIRTIFWWQMLLNASNNSNNNNSNNNNSNNNVRFNAIILESRDWQFLL